MKKISFFFIASLIIGFSTLTIKAQEQKTELPQPTLEQKYNCCEGNFIAHLAASIAYAKLHEETPGNYGKFVGELHAKSWQPENEDNLEYFIKGFHWNMNLFKNFQMEIIEQSDSFIKAKMIANWGSLLIEKERFGVTPDEMREWLEKLWIAIAEHLDLEYKQEFDGEWIVFTVTKK